jgi:MFS family permease
MRNIYILAASQALGMSGVPMFILLGGIIGYEQAPTPALSTLPISLMVVGVALSVIPASLLMKKIGRRAGFITGSLLGAVGALVALLGLAQGNFWLFSLAALLVGCNGAFIQQYRFAAAESVVPDNSGKAVAWVLLGGIAAGFLGPEIARRTRDWLPYGEYTGSFLAMLLVYLGAAALLTRLAPISASQASLTGAERSLPEIARQPVYLAALLAAAVSYGVMSLIMTATPIHLHHNQHFSLDETAWVIQSHIIAMYLPSLVSGFILAKLGVLRLILSGIAAMFVCVGLALVGVDLMHYWWALVLLGVGWNFMFVGGTVLLTRTYSPRERFKAQAANDFTVFTIQALASLSAGSFLYYTSWSVLQFAALPLLALVLAAVLALRRQIMQEIPRIEPA